MFFFFLLCNAIAILASPIKNLFFFLVKKYNNLLLLLCNGNVPWILKVIHGSFFFRGHDPSFFCHKCADDLSLDL